MSKPIDFDAAIRKNAALEMAQLRATNQAQAAELRAKDATIAALRAALDGIAVFHNDGVFVRAHADFALALAASAPRKEGAK